MTKNGKKEIEEGLVKRRYVELSIFLGDNIDFSSVKVWKENLEILRPELLHEAKVIAASFKSHGKKYEL